MLPPRFTSPVPAHRPQRADQSRKPIEGGIADSLVIGKKRREVRLGGLISFFQERLKQRIPAPPTTGRVPTV